MHTTFRPSARLMLGLLTSAVMLLGACSSSSDDSSAGDSTTTVATTTAPDTSTSDTTTADTEPADTTMAVEDIGNNDIRKAMEVDEPELWALVDYDVMSWDAFGGFTVPVPAGTDVAKATELCEAISKIVYQGPDNSITIAGGVSMDNLKGTPIVVRTGASGTCAAA